ncbi:YbaK/EbsC family protein [Demequina sp. TTPB684]|uniref:aminoacyl-tRNA deacylase n=1 Tax=unclassified Demequina TaxID=2620311 RepID=UPI001CF38CC9|nr:MULTISPECIES: YbaK/EbsC family protein [unclassified Demequina]MCB2412875.1 YbaK/EbsC family protein [Demequina sp. TTPB684]UPU88148.1 YbaK/EbsC family protein [Demequina sp. TMPB413]
MIDNPATRALRDSGIGHLVTAHGPVRSLEEAAAARGLEPWQILKTLVVRRAEDDFLLVLVPGDRQISWPKLRYLLGVSRLSMPDKDVARDITGYERGTITPFGSLPAPDGTPWPVVADALIVSREGPVSIGAGEHGVAASVDPAQLVATLSATVADVTEPL